MSRVGIGSIRESNGTSICIPYSECRLICLTFSFELRFSRYSTTSILPVYQDITSRESTSLTPLVFVSTHHLSLAVITHGPHSDGAYLLTPASTHESIRRFWFSLPESRWTAKKQRAVSTPWSKPTSSDLSEKSVWTHSTPLSLGNSDGFWIFSVYDEASETVKEFTFRIRALISCFPVETSLSRISRESSKRHQ